MSSTNNDNSQKKVGRVLHLWLGIFAISAAIGGAGFPLFIVPTSAESWQEMGTELPTMILSMTKHPMLWAIVAVLGGVGAMAAVFLIRPRAARYGAYTLLVAIPAAICLGGIMAWWFVYFETLNNLATNPL